MEYKLPTHNIPISLVADIIIFLNIHPTSSLTEISQFVDKSTSYVRSGIKIAILLGMLKKTDDKYEINKDCTTFLGRTPTEKRKVNLVRKYIQQWEPFLTFINLVLNNNSLEQASRKVYYMFKFENKDPNFLKKLFIYWGKSTNIFIVEDGILNLDKEITKEPEKDIDIKLGLNEDMSVRIKIISILGEQVFNFLKHDEIEELVSAYQKINIDPRNSVECSGRAFEDFLRSIALKVNIDVKRSNGINQIVNKLYNNKDSSGNHCNTIHSKHFK